MSTSTRAGCLAVISRVAAMPSSSGMRMSISTTSGSSRPALWIASWPLEASPTTSRSGWFSSTSRNPARTSDWSSAIRTRMLMRRPIGSRARTRKPPLGRPADVERAAVERDALAHPDQAVAAAVVGARPPFGPAAVVGDLELDRARRVAHDDPGARGAGVLGRCWPAPPARSGTRPGRPRRAARAGSPSTRSSTGRPGVAGALGERARRARGSAAAPARRSRRRSSRRPSSTSASRADRLDQRGALRGALGVALDDALRAAGLDRDHADVVRDDVVQLARDAHPLGRHRGVRLAARGCARSARPCSGARRVSCRWPRTMRPTVHGTRDAAEQRGHHAVGIEDGGVQRGAAPRAAPARRAPRRRSAYAPSA